MTQVKKWVFAMRSWSFTASAIPILVGVAYAAIHNAFHPLLFILTLLAGLAVHAGTNLINTYGDFVSGVDTLESAVTVPELVSGAMQPQTIRKAGFLSFGLAAVIGIVLTLLCGWPVLLFGLLGIVFGYAYTAGFKPYKYIALGPPMVFMLMGPLMTIPSYFIQTGQISWSSAFVSAPIAFLVANILHANELRDIKFDKEAKIKTISIYIGFESARIMYVALSAGAYLSLILLVAFKIVPVTALLPLMLLPMQYKILSGLFAKDSNVGVLEGISGKWHFLFGLLYALGIILPLFFSWLN